MFSLFSSLGRIFIYTFSHHRGSVEASSRESSSKAPIGGERPKDGSLLERININRVIVGLPSNNLADKTTCLNALELGSTVSRWNHDVINKKINAFVGTGGKFWTFGMSVCRKGMNWMYGLVEGIGSAFRGTRI